MRRILPFAMLALLLSVPAGPALADGPPPDTVRIGGDLPAETVRVLDGGVAEGPVLAPLPPGIDPADDVGALAALAIQAIRTGNWWALAALALSIVVSLTRRFLGSKVPWLATDKGGFLAVVLLSFFGAAATALLGGVPIGLPLVIDALKVALTAAGGFVGFKKLFLDGDKVRAAGDAAASAPTGGAEAVVGKSKPLGA